MPLAEGHQGQRAQESDRCLWCCPRLAEEGDSLLPRVDVLSAPPVLLRDWNEPRAAQRDSTPCAQALASEVTGTDPREPRLGGHWTRSCGPQANSGSLFGYVWTRTAQSSENSIQLAGVAGCTTARGGRAVPLLGCRGRCQAWRSASPARQVVAPPQADVQKGTRLQSRRRAPQQGAGRVAPPHRAHWLRGGRAGPDRRTIGCCPSCLHMGRSCRAQPGPARGTRVAKAAAEVGPRTREGPVPGSQVTPRGPRLAGGAHIRKRPPLGGCGGAGGQGQRGLDAKVGEDRAEGSPFSVHPPGRPSRRRAATAHRTLRCSRPTVRVTAADLSLGSASPWPLSGPGLAGRQVAT